MEESKELQGAYKIFRAVIYISLLVEFFEYAINPEMLDHWGGVLSDIHGRIKQWMIYQDGNLIFSKVATFLLICITCVGTRNKKHLEFDARKQVLYPLVSGVFLIALSVWLFGNTMDMRLYSLRLNIILYMIATIIGTVLVHIALDNISKFLKEGLLKDRFNFENESFEQCKDKQENKYSVNIPMRYYYKGKFRKGWVNIVNPFRGTWVVGTPGSGKTFSIIEPFIRQHSEKGFAMVVYDYKFPTLATKLYYHYKKNQKLGKLPEHCKFNIINFVEVEYSRRVNPIQQKYINSTTETLRVYSNEAFQKKIKRQQAWASALYGLSAGLNAGMAGYQTSYVTTRSYNGYTYTQPVTTYNSTAAYQANMAATTQLMVLSKQMEQDKKIREEGYLKKTTIHSSEGIFGYMNVEREKGTVMRVVIPVNGENYGFHWDVANKKK